MSEDLKHAVSVVPIDLPSLDARPRPTEAEAGISHALLDSVPVSIDVRLGSRSLTLGELMALREGSVLELDRRIDQDVELYLNARLIGRGQIVAVDDDFGVRITELAQETR